MGELCIKQEEQECVCLEAHESAKQATQKIQMADENEQCYNTTKLKKKTGEPQQIIDAQASHSLKKKISPNASSRS